MADLSNQVVAVAGANGALGQAVARRLAASGAALILLDRSPFPGTADGARIVARGGLDLTDASAVGAALDPAVAAFGRLDGLVATAGGFETGPVEAAGRDAWERMLAANLHTAVACCRAAIPHLARQGGAIVTIGARPAFRGAAGVAPYAAAKAAVMRLTESLAEELRDRQVTANCIAPSIIDTPANRAAMPDADPARWVSPSDLADIVAFLLSAPARAISGATIPVYGRA